MSFKIVAIGRSQILYESVKLLHREGYIFKGIITGKAVPEYTKKEKDFEKLAQRIDCSYIFTQTLDKEHIANVCQGADIGISINWVSIIYNRHINWFKLGILNAHMGDLPKYRGNACPNWAILQGEEEVVLSIHFMEGGKLDVGRIVVQEKMKIDEETYIDDIYKWAEQSVPLAFLKALKILEKDPNYALKHAFEDDPEAFRCYPRLPEYSYIDWNKSVIEIHRLIRASTYPYEAYTYNLENERIRKLYIKRARIVCLETKDLAEPGHILKNDKITGETWVKCGDGILAIELCRYEDEKEYFFPGKKWKSIRTRLGLTLVDLIPLGEKIWK